MADGVLHVSCFVLQINVAARECIVFLNDWIL